MVLPLLPLYAAQFGADATAVGLLVGLYAGVQFVCLPAIGALSDRVGRRPVLLACLLGTAAAYGLLALASSLPLMVCALLLDAITGGNLSVAQALAADRTAPEERAGVMGRLGVAFALGLVVGPAVGGALGGMALRLPFAAAFGLALANVLVGLVALRGEHGRQERRPARDGGWAFVRGWWGDGAVRHLLLALFLLNLAFAGLQSNFPLFSATRFGWDARANGSIFTLVGICAVLAQGVLVGRLQRWIGGRAVVRCGFVGLAAGLGWMGLAGAAWALFPAVCLAALGSSLAIPTLTALLSSEAGEERQGAVLGSMAALLSLTQVIGPPLAGFLFDRVGPPAPYLLGSALAGLGLAVFMARSARQAEA